MRTLDVAACVLDILKKYSRMLGEADMYSRVKIAVASMCLVPLGPLASDSRLCQVRVAVACEHRPLARARASAKLVAGRGWCGDPRVTGEDQGAGAADQGHQRHPGGQPAEIQQAGAEPQAREGVP